MDIHKINKLISRIRLINNHFILCDTDILLQESRDFYLRVLNEKYGSYLKEQLYKIYDDYFEDSDLEPIQNYLDNEGVYVEGDEFGQSTVSIQIKSQPLRIEVIHTDKNIQHIIWQAA